MPKITDPAFITPFRMLVLFTGGFLTAFLPGIVHAQTVPFPPLMITHDPATFSAEIKTTTIDATGAGYYLLTYTSVPPLDWKNQLEAQGATVMEYVPPYSCIIRSAASQVSSLSRMAKVQSITDFEPAYRLSQRALNLIYTQPAQYSGSAPTVYLSITLFPGEDLQAIENQLAALGAIFVQAPVTTAWRSKLTVELPLDRLTQATAIAGIRWIEPAPDWQPFNNRSAAILGVTPVRESVGLFGSGQTLGIADTGLDAGQISVDQLLDDFENGAGESRVTQIIDVAQDGNSSDAQSGHGTHVAGSAIGNGQLSGCQPLVNQYPDTCFAGMVPQAHLVFQALENNQTGKFLPPADLNTLFAQAQQAGAQLHSNSWGTVSSGEYTLDAQETDQYSWDHPDFLIVFAVGNSGVDQDANGVVDLWSLATPATAKNALSIGSSEGNRPNEGLINTWGLGSPLLFPVPPLAPDPLSDNPNGLAASSSRGPTWDGRIKPDLVAPGTNILSTRSTQISSTGWAPHDNPYYMYLGGTSMATPLAAGSAVLMREYLIKKQGFAAPSSALIKAALINSAENIAPGQYGTGKTQEIPDNTPNFAAGWGRVNLAQGIYPVAPQQVLYIDNPATHGLNTSDIAQWPIQVQSNHDPLKIHLVWNDYPGSPPLGSLVNDLDLELIGPDQTIYYPNRAQAVSTQLLRYDADAGSNIYNAPRLAVKFTPDHYPTRLDAIRFFWVNLGNQTDPMAVVVYDDDGENGAPGTERLRVPLTFTRTGWITFGLENITLTEGSYYLVLETTKTTQTIVVDSNTNPTQRSWIYDGQQWQLSPHTHYIRALATQLEDSVQADHTNNVEGIEIPNPTPGLYKVQVKGHRIPFGPQGYAMVLSGDFITCHLDIDANGRADALTDGLLFLRYLFGFRGETLIHQAVDTVGGQRTAAAEIEAYLAHCQGVFDIDANQRLDALTDGILTIRYLFGFRGETLLNNAVDMMQGTRITAPEIEAYLQALIP